MSRPKKHRCLGCKPNIHYFKPRGIPLPQLKELALSLDELEAIRLADYEGYYHVHAALKMEVSRATFGRILNQARKKVAEAIVHGKALRIESTQKKEDVNESMFRRSKR